MSHNLCPRDSAQVLFPQGLGGVIFDCDGVMIDSREANAVFFNRILACFDLPPMTPEQEAFSFMATSTQALEHILPACDFARLDEVLGDAVDYQRDIMPLLRLMPGLREFTDILHQAGVRMAIATNRTSRGIERVLDIFALPSYFNPVVTASNAPPKPSPEGARRICAAWGLAPERVLFVGDSASDKQTAMDAGVRFAAFNGGSLQGDLQASNFTELGRKLAVALSVQPGQAQGSQKQ